ncbi:MAG: corrinoid protein [Oligoflexia bacterium]|nr:corrinoid protein [Oligoflexia bacterium]
MSNSSNSSNSILQQIAEELINGEEERVAELTKAAIGQAIPAKKILEEGLIAGMNVIGARFKQQEIFLPEVLLSAKAMSAGVEEIRPLLASESSVTAGKVILGTVQGDLHDIGKNLVSIMLKGAGLEIIDLGKDVSAAKFVEVAKKENASVIGMSALLTTTMPVMSEVVTLLREQGLSDKIKTVVGGAPLTREWAQEIGASAYSADAGSAVEMVKELTRN